MFIIDEGRKLDLQHPIHIHGYSPYIIATERHAIEPESFFPIGNHRNKCFGFISIYWGFD